jgi:hypothetical protein
VNTLAPKLILTPLLVSSASLAGRRWGPLLSGWIIALPLTSGPIALFIALELGPRTAIDAAAGSLLGGICLLAYSLVYARAAVGLAWQPTIAIAGSTYLALGLLMPPLPVLVLWAGIAVGVPVTVFFLSRGPRHAARDAVVVLPSWDIPARVLVATMLVVGISASAPLIGGRAAGVLATFPVYASVLATFAHRLRGPGDGIAVLRGMVTGLLGFATFFLVLGQALAATSIPIAFGLAVLSGLAVQAASLLPLLAIARRGAGGRVSAETGAELGPWT